MVRRRAHRTLRCPERLVAAATFRRRLGPTDSGPEGRLSEADLRGHCCYADRVGQPRTSRSLLAGALLLAAVFFTSYLGILGELVYRWGHEADYSHGFLVPVFSAW